MDRDDNKIPTLGYISVVVVSPNRLQGLKISGSASERRQEEITTCKRKAENRERLLTQYHDGKRKCKKAIGPRMHSYRRLDLRLRAN